MLSIKTFALGGLLVATVACLFGSGGVIGERFVDVFTPLRTEWVALSPDSKHIAYSIREGETLSVVVVPSDNPTQSTAKVIVGTDKSSTPTRLDLLYVQAAENTPAKILWMGWANPRRVMVVTNRTMTSGGNGGGWYSLTGAIYGFDLDGANAGLLASPRKFTGFEHSTAKQKLSAHSIAKAIGTDLKESNMFLVEAHEGYLVDANNGKIRELDWKVYKEKAGEIMREKETRRTAWSLQYPEFTNAFPGLKTEIIETDKENAHALAMVHGVADAGAFHFFDALTKKSTQFVHRSPLLRDKYAYATHNFDYMDGANTHIRGWVVLPKSSRTQRSPLVFLDLDKARPLQSQGQPSSDLSAFRPEVLALAEMGFAVVQLEERPKGVQADLEATRLADLKLVCQKLAAEYTVSAKRIALYGTWLGGEIAFQMAKLDPSFFRCVVAIRPAVYLSKKIELPEQQNRPEYTGKLGVIPVPVLLFGERLSMGSSFWEIKQAYCKNKEVYSVELVETEADFSQRLPRACAQVFRKIEDFLNMNLYAYRVEAGETKVIDD